MVSNLIELKSAETSDELKYIFDPLSCPEYTIEFPFILGVNENISDG